MKNGIKKRYILAVLLFVLACSFVNPSMILAQTTSHTVQKGDTLWGICEKYYGNPDIWPKLWQMNPFVTNPHLLNPGDVITLFEKDPVMEVTKPQVVKMEPPVKKPEPESAVMGVNVEGFTDVNTLGFLSLEKIQPWGNIFASDSGKLILGNGENAFVIFDESKEIKVGDEFSIGMISPLLKHPVTGKKLGYTYSINGRLVVEERLGLAHSNMKFYEKKNVFQTKIIESHEPIHIDNIVIPFTSVSPCVLPVPSNKELLANIVATKRQQVLINPNSIVYIDRGFNHGVNRGNVFEVVKANIVPDPKKPEKEFYRPQNSKIILPDIRIGMIMILESRPDTSSAIVLFANEPIPKGAYIKNISWVKTPDFLLSRASCPVE
ncbi:MAG: LysM peptidoglycan-binding domain-containing protein [Deltaproteobacteria bacterium]|nr:LysM peptidoglycan-binding domain-containing protein [Deltaproteobacteria bacterium]